MSTVTFDDAGWSALRATLFGDLPPDRWPDGYVGAPPWTSFATARDHLGSGEVDLAIRTWAGIANPVSGHEPRHVLQAWHFLRSHGVEVDPSIAHEPLGVVAEVAVGGGHDVLAAYRDGSVRYLNHAGPVSVVEAGAARAAGARRLEGAVDAWLTTAARTVSRLDPVAGPLALPEPGRSRFTVLTCGGHRVVEGREPELDALPGAGALWSSGAGVLAALGRQS
jgi:hypothetical protein